LKPDEIDPTSSRFCWIDLNSIANECQVIFLCTRFVNIGKVYGGG